MIYKIYKVIDGRQYYEGKGDLNYLKRILLYLSRQGFTEENIIIKEET